MGARLHYSQHFDPDWQGGYFNRDQEAWHELYKAAFSENGWESENECQYEIERADLKAYLQELETLPNEDKNKYFTDYTNEQVISDLEMLLSSDDDRIHIEWF